MKKVKYEVAKRFIKAYARGEEEFLIKGQKYREKKEYEEGVIEALEGITIDDENPYSSNSVAHARWAQGFKECMRIIYGVY